MKNKYLTKEEIQKSYSNRRKWLGAGKVLTGIATGVSSIGLLGMGFTSGDPVYYRAAAETAVGGGAIIKGLDYLQNNTNPKREQKALDDLSNYVNGIKVQVSNLEKVKTKGGVKLENSLN